jgi:hypothetical protein
MFKPLIFLAPLCLLAVPALAEGDTMMADHAMKPMSKSEKRMMAKCKAMKPEMAAKDAKCAKLMMKPMDKPMEKPMGSGM